MKLKIGSHLLLSIVLAGGVHAAERPEVPNVAAHTDIVGKRKNVKTTDSDGFNQTQDMRSLSVVVELRSFHPPKQPYDVECFFIARSESTKSNYIYDVIRQSSSAQSDVLKFQPAPLGGNGRRWITLPMTGSFTGATSSGDLVTGLVSGEVTYSQRIDGSKFYGWLVRVISQGTVVRMETNQPQLKILAEKNPGIFNSASKETK